MTIDLNPSFSPSLSIFRDEDLAQHDFKSCFERIDDGLFAYVEHGNFPAITSLSECFDTTSGDWREMRKAFIAYSLGITSWNDEPLYDSVKDFLSGFNLPTAGDREAYWRDAFFEALEENSSLKELAENETHELLDLAPSVVLKVAFVSVTGYSQGDYLTAVVDREAYEQATGKPFSETLESLSNCIENLAFNQPLSVCLELREGEDEWLYPADSYEYDKDEILKLCSEAGVEEDALEKIGESLPDYF